MSAGRSPSGFASLRAKFEQKQDSTSPPSRGRSPADPDSVSSDESRPLSKVRTSFVAVKPNRKMEEQLQIKESSSNGRASGGDGTGETEANVNGVSHMPKINGDVSAVTSATQAEKGKSEKTSEAVGGLSPGDPDKLVSAAEENNPSMSQADVEDENAVSVGGGRPAEVSGLGSILKGSPFEQDEGKKGESSKSQMAGPPPSQPQSPQHKVKTSKAAMVNGKPKGSQAGKVGLEPEARQTPRPSAIETKAVSRAAPSISTEKPGSNPPKAATPGPRTLKSATTPGNQLPAKKMPPKQITTKEPKKDGDKDLKNTSRPSVISKQPTTSKLGPGPSTAKPVKTAGPTSPPTTTKPRPKSPTRPVRLPTSATAPTAASAAKLDGGPGPAAKPRGQFRPNGPRLSLPAGSRPPEKVKSSRMSTTSSKAPDSFLERMMRPTQSSAQKTHEKFDEKIPPRNDIGSRPKRKSSGSRKSNSEDLETKDDESKESAAPVGQGLAESSKDSTTNVAQTDTNGAATATPVATPPQ